MTAREKLQKLTNGWYSMAVVSALASLLVNGIGVFSLIGTLLSTGFMFVLTWWIGRKLMNRSSLMRSVCILLSVAGAVLGIVALFGLGKSLFEEFALSTILEMVLAGMGLSLNVRSFRILTDTQVRQYVQSEKS